MRQPLAGLVLAGGKSRRLGTDKGRLALADGRPLILAVIETVSGLCDEVAVVTDTPGRYADLRLSARRLTDIVPDRGPLAGLHAGLTGVESPFALTVACDMPFLNPDLLAYMAELPRRYQALVPRVEGRWHPAHAIYARSCLPVIDGLLAGAEASMNDLLSRLDVRELTADELREHDPEGLSLFNLNSQEDLERARDLSARAARG